MEKKQGGLLNILAIVLGVVLLLVVVLGGVLLVKTRIPGLKPVNHSVDASDGQSAADGVDVEEVEQNFEGFSVGASEKGQETEPENEMDIAGYFCSYSSEQLLTEDDMILIRDSGLEIVPEGKTIQQMVINEMYARYGYQFQSEELQKYFEEKEWYLMIDERYTDMGEVYEMMNDIEKENIEFLQNFEY